MTAAMVPTAFRSCEDCGSWSGGQDGKCTSPDAPHHGAGSIAAKWCGIYSFRAPATTMPPDQFANLASARSMLKALLPDLGAAADLARSAGRGDLSEAVQKARRDLGEVLAMLEAMVVLEDPRHGGA